MKNQNVVIFHVAFVYIYYVTKLIFSEDLFYDNLCGIEISNINTLNIKTTNMFPKLMTTMSYQGSNVYKNVFKL